MHPPRALEPADAEGLGAGKATVAQLPPGARRQGRARVREGVIGALPGVGSGAGTGEAGDERAGVAADADPRGLGAGAVGREADAEQALLALSPKKAR